MVNCYKVLFVVLQLFLVHIIAVGQEHSDGTQANGYYTKGDSLKRLTQYALAIENYEKAAQLYEKNQNWEKYAQSIDGISDVHYRTLSFNQGIDVARAAITKCELNLSTKSIGLTKLWNTIGKHYGRLGDFDLAKDALNRSLQMNRSISSKPNFETAQIYNSLSSLFQKVRSYDSAIFYLEKVLEIGEEPYDQMIKILPMTYVNLSRALLDQNELIVSISYLHKGFEMHKKEYGMNNDLGATIYNDLAIAYHIKGYYSKAVKYYRKCLEVISQLSGENRSLESACYGNLGFLYASIGDHNISLEYQKKSLSFTEFLQDDKYALTAGHLNIGISYFYLQQYGKALKHFGIAKEYAENLISGKEYELSRIYLNMGTVYYEEGKYDKAESYFNEALKVGIPVTGENQFWVSAVMNHLGEDRKRQKKYEESVNYFNRALEIKKIVYGAKHPNLAIEYIELGDLCNETGEYNKALHFFKQAQESNSYQEYTDESKLELNTISFDHHLYLQSFYGMGSSFVGKYKESSDLTQLKSALGIFQKCDSLIKRNRQTRTNYVDKIELGELSSKIYEKSIWACLRLYEVTNDETYKNMAFDFSEANKAGVLVDAISHLSAKNNGAIPEELIEFETSLKIDIAYFQSQVHEERSKEQSDSLEVVKWEGRLFDRKRSIDSLITVFEKDYPNYYQLKFGSASKGVSEVQENLNDNTGLIEYFIGDSVMYTFVLTNNGFQIFEQEIGDLDNDISDFRVNLESEISHKAPYNLLKSYIQKSYDLNSRVLDKPLTYLRSFDKIDQLIIIPDGALSYLPFELLITSKPPPETLKYAQLDYLLIDYTISYGYSSILNLQDQSMTRNIPSKLNYLGYAPSYEEGQFQDSTVSFNLGKFRSAVTSLESNQDEIEGAGQLMAGDYYLAQNATETSFKENIGKYNIIHLAMHALVDDENPMNSKLVFAQKKDSLNDGFLYTHEILNLNITPELIVLSACNTGYGELQKGEGLMSLAYSFVYAGCPSAIVSQWQVDDKSTNELMQLFYENLADGMPKNKALRQAKLTFLETANGRNANPYYWGGFVLIGDESPVISDDNYGLIFLALTLVLIITIVGVIRMRLKR